MTETEIEIDQSHYNSFLDQLRESGAINMFGATKVLEDVFDLKRSEAKVIFNAWVEYRKKLAGEQT